MPRVRLLIPLLAVGSLCLATPSHHNSVLAARGLPPQSWVSDPIGGTGGTPFDDTSALPASPKLKHIILGGDARLDSIALYYTEGNNNPRHGGEGGTVSQYDLAAGEYITTVKICDGTHESLRIFYLGFTTSANKLASVGTETASCKTFTCASGSGVVGFHGRAKNGIDALGVICAPQ